MTMKLYTSHIWNVRKLPYTFCDDPDIRPNIRFCIRPNIRPDFIIYAAIFTLLSNYQDFFNTQLLFRVLGKVKAE